MGRHDVSFSDQLLSFIVGMRIVRKGATIDGGVLSRVRHQDEFVVEAGLLEVAARVTQNAESTRGAALFGALIGNVLFGALIAWLGSKTDNIVSGAFLWSAIVAGVFTVIIIGMTQNFVVGLVFFIIRTIELFLASTVMAFVLFNESAYDDIGQALMVALVTVVITVVSSSASAQNASQRAKLNIE